MSTGPPLTFSSRHRKRKADGSSLAKRTAKGPQYHCNHCKKDISGQIRIRCAVCPDFDLCLDCFRVGVELKGTTGNAPPHLNSHNYRVVDNLRFPLYHPSWGADEELLLLEAIDNAGLGNWTAIAEATGSKSEAECKHHYYTVYVDHDQFPLPKPEAEMKGINPADYLHSVAKFDQLAAKYANKKPSTATTAGGVSGRAIEDAGYVTAGEDEDDEPASKAATRTRGGGRGRAGGRGRGGRPRGGGRGRGRGIADSAYGGDGASQTTGDASAADPTGSVQGGVDSDAYVDAEEDAQGGKGAVEVKTEGGEAMDVDTPASKGKSHPGAPTGKHAAKIKHPPSTTPAATTATTQHPAAAGKTLRQDNTQAPAAVKVGASLVEITTFNIMRNEFEHEYDNEAEVMIADMEFRPEDTQEDWDAKQRLLAIYNGRLDEREKRREFIKTKGLLNTRMLQSLERKRVGVDKDMYAQVRAFTRYSDPVTLHVLAEGLAHEHRLRQRIQELKELRRNGVRTFAQAEDFELRKRKRVTADVRAQSAQLAQAMEAQASTNPANTDALVKAVVESVFGSTQQLEKAITESTDEWQILDGFKSAGPALNTWRNKQGVGLDITACPGTEHLAAKERELCATLRMLPAHYLLLKSHLMRESAKQPLTRQEARNIFRLEPTKALRVYDLLVATGCIQSADPPSAAAAGNAAADGGGGGSAEGAA